MRRLLITAMLAFTGLPAAAFDGNALHKMMQEPDAKVGTAAYIRGYLDASSFYRNAVFLVEAGTRPARLFCMPAGATVEQAHDIVRNYLAANPQHRHYEASVLTLTALQNAWPCGR